MKSNERLTDLILAFDEGAEIHGYRVTGDAIEFFGRNGETLTPSYSAIGSGYERDSGKYKSTARVAVDPQNISASIQSWVERYDQIYAVDTNTVELGGETICVTCCVRGEIEFVENKWNARITVIDALVFCNPIKKPELIGWVDVIQRINSDASIRIGLVVDSELDRIPHFNRRNVPILDGYHLPENIELIYASAERDKNIPFNFFIAKCEADATLLIRKIKNDKNRLAALTASNGDSYESSYYWLVKNGQKA